MQTTDSRVDVYTELSVGIHDLLTDFDDISEELYPTKLNKLMVPFIRLEGRINREYNARKTVQ